jgi:hypothetical protein
MRVEVLVVPNCPHAGTAAAVARQALDDVGLTTMPVTVVISVRFEDLARIA